MLVTGGAGDAQSNEGHTASADGRFVVFSSFATNLVESDSNGAQDVFLWDTQLESVSLVSQSAQGVAGNGDSSLAVISADGIWVAFLSQADNLTVDTNGDTADVFLYNRLTSAVELVSVSSAGVQSSSPADNPDINANGRYVTFDAIADFAEGAGVAVRNVFRRDNWLDTTALMSRTPAGGPPDNMSFNAQMSANGARVVFVSMSSDLVSTPTVGKDSFLFDVRTESTTLLSLNATAQAGDGTSYFPTISGDGKIAAFHSFASNLVENDAEGRADIILRDLQSGVLELVSKTPSQNAADSDSILPALDYTGNRVAYISFAGNLVPGATQGRGEALLFDRSTQTTIHLSETEAGVGGNGSSASPALSLDGSTSVFVSTANNLSENGTDFADLLVAEVATDAVLVSLGAAVLPSSRSTQIGEVLTVFASVVGTELVNGCTVALSSDIDVTFGYQLTDPVTNAAIGPTSGEFLILPGVAQTLVLTMQPNVELRAEELEFAVSCDQGTAPVVPGTNTLLVSAETTQPPDVVALAATVGGDGIILMPVGGAGGFFSVASINLGSADNIKVRPVVLGQALDSVSVCQTNPATGVCLAAPGAEVALTFNTGDTPTFGVFATSVNSVPFNPGVNRLVLQFEDDGGTIRGRTSVAVRSVP